MSCSHQMKFDRYVEKDDGYGGTYHEWETYTESYCVDIDTHRYRCKRCGEVMYYSGAAKQYYETGVDRKGLFS